MPNKEKTPSKQITGIAFLIIVLWGVELVNLVLDHQLCRWGILPRTVSGLVGILFSPFLHGSLVHLLANTLPLAVLGGLVGLHGRLKFFEVTVIILLLGGGGVWLMGRPSYHVGASGLIFGYFGFLVLRGVYQKSIGAFIVSIITLLLYGGLIWGVLPTIPHVSWEGHLSGLFAGIVSARLEGRGNK